MTLSWINFILILYNDNYINYIEEENMEIILFSTLGLIFGVILTTTVVFILIKSKGKKSDNIIEKAKKRSR